MTSYRTRKTLPQSRQTYICLFSLTYNYNHTYDANTFDTDTYDANTYDTDMYGANMQIYMTRYT